MLFTFVVSYRLATVTTAEDRARFEGLVQEVHLSIESRLETYRALVRSGAGVFAASDSVDRAQFKSFVDKLGVAENYPGLRGIGFSVRVKPEEKMALIDAMKAQGLSDFRVWPEGQRSEYYAIIYLEPDDERNRAALGFDMFTEQVRRSAMERARDTGKPAASHRVTPVRELNPVQTHTGFLIYAPVYRHNQPTSTESERREALAGYVHCGFRAEEFLRGVIPPYSQENIAFQIYSNDPNQKISCIVQRTLPSVLPRATSRDLQLRLIWTSAVRPGPSTMSAFPDLIVHT